VRVSLIISTYDNPAALRLSLLGVLAQSRPPDEIVIADDGSSEATAALLRQPKFAALPIRHAWHPDRGWRKSKVMNLAIALSTGEYLVGMDGDCIPRRDFLASHLRHARPRMFLSGPLIRVPADIHQGFTDEEILDNWIFSPRQLEARWPAAARHRRQLEPGRLEPWLNLVSWRPCVLMGGNFSLWRSDVLAVNGFDESFVYGKEDRELGVRLRNAGVASRWLKYSLIVLHLDHPRSWVDLDRYREQRRRIRRLWFSGTTRITPGIDTARARAAEECV
jgi:glycosyltransferase involved in cell wall biosynthesis